MAVLQEHSLIKRCYYMMYLFMAGVVLGIVLVNAGHGLWVTEDGLLNVEMLLRMKRSIPEAGGILPYVMKSRISVLGMLLILSTTMIGVAAVCGYVVYCGVCAGCLLSVAAIRYGLRGILFVAAGIFPQGILLMPGYMLLLCCALDCNRLLCGHGERYGILAAGMGAGFWMKKAVQIAVLLFFVLLGCVVESYVNPKLLHAILGLICS